jgi:hypothetical protein
MTDTADVTLPDWIPMMVGRLTLENEALRQALASTQAELAQAMRRITNGTAVSEVPVP